MTSVRRLLWSAGAPARFLLLGAISLYRVTLSGWLGGQCRFSPTCSPMLPMRSALAGPSGERSWRAGECCAAILSDEVGWIRSRHAVSYDNAIHNPSSERAPCWLRSVRSRPCSTRSDGCSRGSTTSPATSASRSSSSRSSSGSCCCRSASSRSSRCRPCRPCNRRSRRSRRSTRGTSRRSKSRR